jgi:hypothetical protein
MVGGGAGSGAMIARSRAGGAGPPRSAQVLAIQRSSLR